MTPSKPCVSRKEFKEHEIQTQVMEAWLHNYALSHAEVLPLLSLLRAMPDPKRASGMRNKGGICSINAVVQAASDFLDSCQKHKEGLSYYDLRRADK